MERNSTLKFGNKLGCSLRVITLFDIFLLNVNFDKFSIELHFLHGDQKKNIFLIISFIFVQFVEDKKSIVI